MDTNRIVIYNHDLSTATVEQPVRRCGFTVVDAEKGPKTPVLIPAGGTDKLQDIFGKPSKDYPQLYEVQSFISGAGYATYVSAPYKNAKVPVAYITGEGVFPAEELVTYDDKIEKIVSEEYLEEEVQNIPGITSFTNGVVAKIDTRYPKSNLNLGTDLPAGKSALLFKQAGVEGESLEKNTAYLGVYTGIEANAETVEYTLLQSDAPYDETGDTTYYKFIVGQGYVEISQEAAEEGEEIEIDSFLKEVLKEDFYSETGAITYKEGDLYNENITYYKKVVAEETTTYTAVEDKANIVKRVFDRAAYIKAPTSELSLTSTFEQLVADGTISGLKVEGFKEDIGVVASLIIPESIDSEGIAHQDPNDVYIEWSRGDLPCILKLVSGDAYLWIPLTKTEASWASATENLKTIETYWKEKFAAEDIVGVIFPKYPSERVLHLEFSDYDPRFDKSTMTPAGRNFIRFNAYEEGAFKDGSSSTHMAQIEGSLDGDAVNENGKYLAFNKKNESYKDQNLVTVFSLGGFKDTTGLRKIKGYGKITLKGGKREAGDLEEGWSIAKSEEYSVVDIFFDSRRHTNEASSLNSEFFSLAKAHPLSGFIFNVTPSDLANIDSFNQLSFGPNYWSICNEAIIPLTGSTRIVSPLTGTRAQMQLRIIENRWGGIAPMYLNSGTPSMGGQLEISASDVKLRFKYTKDQQEKLEKLNMNPIIRDNTYGIIVVGQKTCRIGELTDWSYIGHVSAFLEFEREVRETVMIPQLGKANNEYYRSLRKQQVENILQKRLSGTTRIWAAASVDTSTAAGVNDIAARRARKFIINVRVKVDVFSEVVELNFTNVDQSMEV